MCKSTNTTDKKCVLCDRLCNMIDYECILCFEYVCIDCGIQFGRLNKMLEEKQFEQFEQYIETYHKESKLLKLV